MLDSLAVLALAGWLSLQGNWGCGAITVLTFILGSQLPRPNRRQAIFAGLGLVVTVVAAIVGGNSWPEGGLSGLAALIGFGIAVLFVPVILAAGQVKSVGDQTGARLSPARVQAGQAVALLTGVETAFWGGTGAFGSLTPLWAAVLGAWIYSLLGGQTLKSRRALFTSPAWVFPVQQRC